MTKEASAPTASDLGFDPISTQTSAAFGLLRVSALLSEELDRELQASAGLGLSEMLVLIQLMLAGAPFAISCLPLNSVYALAVALSRYPLRQYLALSLFATTLTIDEHTPHPL